MKIEGTVNIMGMREVIFGKTMYDKFYPMINYIKLQNRWVRLTDGIADGFYRTNDEMLSSIKSMAYNPNIGLTFNDGAMYVDISQESLSEKEWKHILVYTKEHTRCFVDAMKEMLDS